MNNCSKCDSGDILTRHVKQGELVDSSSRVEVEDEFISSSEYDFYYQLKAKKEHLHRHCRNCQYEWNENTVNNGG